MAKRVFLVVLDSFGTGIAPDASDFGDEGSNTLAAVLSDSTKSFPNMAKMGMLSLDGLYDQRTRDFINAQESLPSPIGSYGIIRELSRGKDSTIGHWEIMGILSEQAQPTYPDGFPAEILSQIEKISGRGVFVNKPYSGTAVINDYGEEHMKTGNLIVYTSADSVLQIAAHEDIVPVEELYRICSETRKIMTGKHGVGRIIARPFLGEPGNFYRTERRHDYSLTPDSSTMLDMLKMEGFDVISIGKINDLYAGRGITESNPTKGNTDGISKIIDFMDRDFNGICFANLVDFDMKFGHRNDIPGYAAAMHEWDDALGIILDKLKEDDLLIITADHGCDPSTPSTDHSRETIPVLIYGEGYNVPNNMGELVGFSNIANIVATSLIKRDFKRVFAISEAKTPDEENIYSQVDLTNLKTVATPEDIDALLEKAIAKDCASVCIPPCYVSYAANGKYRDKIRICTVIGFPNGYSTTGTKLYETREALDAGASEIDMVINIGFVKAKMWDKVQHEIKLLADMCHSKGGILKVIIETCSLTEEEIVKMCEIVTNAKADYIKTSTGFGSAGATLENVKLMSTNVGPNVKVKAAGGIRSEELAKEMINNGASRIGASGL